jgi:hypothetical protein
MTSKTDKAKQAELERQAAAERAAKDAAMAAAAAPKPVETALDKENLDWINGTSGKDGPVDYSKLSALNFDLYGKASQRQEGERMGIGALQLGQQGSNPMLSQLLRSQQDDQRQQDASGGFETGVRMKDAQVRGNLLPLLSLQQNRSMGLAGMASNNSQNSTNSWANFRPAPSIWAQLLQQGFGAAGQIGAAYAGAPGTLGKKP